MGTPRRTPTQESDDDLSRLHDLASRALVRELHVGIVKGLECARRQFEGANNACVENGDDEKRYDEEDNGRAEDDALPEPVRGIKGQTAPGRLEEWRFRLVIGVQVIDLREERQRRRAQERKQPNDEDISDSDFLQSMRLAGVERRAARRVLVRAADGQIAFQSERDLIINCNYEKTNVAIAVSDATYNQTSDSALTF